MEGKFTIKDKNDGTTEIKSNRMQTIHFTMSKQYQEIEQVAQCPKACSLSELGLNLRPLGPVTTYVAVEVKIQVSQ